MLVYTVVLAGFLAVFFDLSRIASLGAFFYLVMDIIVHLGVLRFLRQEVGAKAGVLISAIILDSIVLVVFAKIKLASDPLIVAIALAAIVATFLYERMYLARWLGDRSSTNTHAGHAADTSGDRH